MVAFWLLKVSTLLQNHHKPAISQIPVIDAS